MRKRSSNSYVHWIAASKLNKWATVNILGCVTEQRIRLLHYKLLDQWIDNIATKWYSKLWKNGNCCFTSRRTECPLGRASSMKLLLAFRRPADSLNVSRFRSKKALTATTVLDRILQSFRDEDLNMEVSISMSHHRPTEPYREASTSMTHHRPEQLSTRPPLRCSTIAQHRHRSQIPH